MLTAYRPRYIEKILTNERGERFVVLFQVELVNGKLAAKFVSATKVDSRFKIQDSRVDALCLPGETSDCEYNFVYRPSFKRIISPFNEFFFFNSQPTRAPSL